MTRGVAAIASILMSLGVAGPVFTQQPDDAEQLRLGRDAMAAHDPAAAIRHFEQLATREAREWLAVALMTESGSPSDQYVERAFEAAMRARAEPSASTLSRAELVAALRPGDMVIAFLIGETSWAWAFDRDAFIGYALPAPDLIATAASRARAYLDSGNREGVTRIAEDLMPALLGAASQRLPQLKRLIFVVDGPLRGLPLGALPAGEQQSPLQQQVAVSVVEYRALLDAIKAQQSRPAAPDSWLAHANGSAAVAIAILLIAAAAVYVRRKR